MPKASADPKSIIPQCEGPLNSLDQYYITIMYQILFLYTLECTCPKLSQQYLPLPRVLMSLQCARTRIDLRILKTASYLGFIQGCDKEVL